LLFVRKVNVAAPGQNNSAAFRKKVYRSIGELQLDQWVRQYNEERTHSEKYCYGKTPIQTFMDSIPSEIYIG
jgi:hypothetical protein